MYSHGNSFPQWELSLQNICVILFYALYALEGQPVSIIYTYIFLQNNSLWFCSSQLNCSSLPPLDFVNKHWNQFFSSTFYMCFHVMQTAVSAAFCLCIRCFLSSPTHPLSLSLSLSNNHKRFTKTSVQSQHNLVSCRYKTPVTFSVWYQDKVQRDKRGCEKSSCYWSLNCGPPNVRHTVALHRCWSTWYRVAFTSCSLW